MGNRQDSCIPPSVWHGPRKITASLQHSSDCNLGIGSVASHAQNRAFSSRYACFETADEAARAQKELHGKQPCVASSARSTRRRDVLVAAGKEHPGVTDTAKPCTVQFIAQNAPGPPSSKRSDACLHRCHRLSCSRARPGTASHLCACPCTRLHVLALTYPHAADMSMRRSDGRSGGDANKSERNSDEQRNRQRDRRRDESRSSEGGRSVVDQRWTTQESWLRCCNPTVKALYEPSMSLTVAVLSLHSLCTCLHRPRLSPLRSRARPLPRLRRTRQSWLLL